MTSTRTQLNNIVKKNCADLFHHYGLELQEKADDNSWMEFMAVIGYSSDEIRGFLGLATGLRIVEDTHAQLNLGAASEVMLADWLGELLNQLMGRIKNEFASFGFNIYLATPVVLRGVSLRLASKGDEVSCLNMHSESGPITVWLDARYNPGLKLEAIPPDPEQFEALQCGEGALFF